MRATGLRLRAVPLAVLAVLAAGCGTQRAGDDDARADGPGRTPVPSVPSDFACPGESAAPTPEPTAGTSAATAPPTDHYAENHGFRVPLRLHGQARCDGLAAVGRITRALQPLSRRGDFTPQSTLRALAGLGYPADQVRTQQDSPAAVGFLIDAPSLCIEGTMNRAAIEANAFGGYPDGTGCEPPSGGH